MSREVFLRVTMPEGVEGAGVTARNQPARIRLLDIPVRFLTAKAVSTGAALELVLKETVKTDGEETKLVEHSLTRAVIAVSGTTGQMRLEAVNPVQTFVPPKFATTVKFEEGQDEEENEDEEEEAEEGEE